MRRDEFLEGLRGAMMTTGELNEATVLASLGEWDSLAIMATLTFLDRKCGKKVSFETLKAAQTVGDLLKLGGL